MALVNFTLAATEAATPAVIATSPSPLRVDLDDLLYSPEDLQSDYSLEESGNEPFAPPSNQRRSKLKKRAGSTYLPPPNQFAHYPGNGPSNPYSSQLHSQLYQQNSRLDIKIENQRVQNVNPQYDNTGQYVHDPSGDYDYEQRRLNQNPQHTSYNPGYADSYPPTSTPRPSSHRFEGNSNHNTNNFNFLNRPSSTTAPSKPSSGGTKNSNTNNSGQTPLDRPRGFTKVETGSSGGKTQVHAVLDYDDDDDYYDEVPERGKSVI